MEDPAAKALHMYEQVSLLKVPQWEKNFKLTLQLIARLQLLYLWLSAINAKTVHWGDREPLHLQMNGHRSDCY